jgi:hypothetical protein
MRSPALPSVLFVDQSGQLGGAEFALLQLAGSCTARSEVVLLSDGPFRARLEALGAHVQVVNDARVSGIARQASGLNCLRIVPAILRQVRAIAARARSTCCFSTHKRHSCWARSASRCIANR